MELSDLKWYEESPEFYWGEDKEGNVYNMKLQPCPDVNLNNPYFFGASLEQVEEAIARQSLPY